MSSSLPLTCSRFSGAAGDIMIFFSTNPESEDSDTAMCSATSATDQRSGAGLNVHCFCESPAMDFRKLSRVV